LGRVLVLLDVICPSLAETGLLRSALRQLGDRLLLVVVGEFNSGKSTVVNALLGGRFLADGVLPTTNEICVLRSEGAAADSCC
jgi:predicted GTPase